MATKAIQFNDNLITYDDTKYMVNEGADNIVYLELIVIASQTVYCKIFSNAVVHWYVIPAPAKRVRETNGGFTITLD